MLVGGSSFRCANSFNGGGCDFKLGKTICRKELATDEVKPLFETRRSALLEGFVSKRGKPFKAYLVLDAAGKLGFEFEEKPAAKKGAAKKKPAAKKRASA